MKNIRKVFFLLLTASTLFLLGCPQQPKIEPLDLSKTPSYLTILQEGPQRVVAGQKLEVYATIRNGSYQDITKTCTGNITFKAEKGSFDGNIYTPAGEGIEDTITAYYGDLVSSEKKISVKYIEENYMQLPFEYNGKTYKGITSQAYSDIPESDFIDITYPTKTKITADGFFTIEGKVKDSANGYVVLEITKTSPIGEPKGFRYFLRNDFSKRIWLRDGEGDYRINIYQVKSFNGFNTAIDGEIYEGDVDFCGWTYNTNNSIGFRVHNDNPEYGAWIYPSDYVQSDDITIMNMADSLTVNCKTDLDAFYAINNFVSCYIYDDSSLETSKRKKQDAVSVVKYRDAICAGYSYLTAALLRYKGIPAKSIYGRMERGNNDTYHAWNNLTFDNGETWYFCEPQHYYNISNKDDELITVSNYYDNEKQRYEYLYQNGFTDESGAIWNRTLENDITFDETWVSEL